jgi:hypothetical protein
MTATSRCWSTEGLAGLRPATPPVEPAHEYRLDPSVQRVLSDDSIDKAPTWALVDQLGSENPELKKLLDDWRRRFPGSPIRVGGGGEWIQDTGYWEAWDESQRDKRRSASRASAASSSWRPADAAGRWYLNRLQLLYQCT